MTRTVCCGNYAFDYPHCTDCPVQAAPDRETQLKEALRALNERYRAEAQPIIDELARLEALRPPVPMVIDPDMLKDFKS